MINKSIFLFFTFCDIRSPLRLLVTKASTN